MNPRRIKNVNCCVFGCHSVGTKNPDLSFHGFPKSGERKVTIVSKLGISELVDKRKAWIWKIRRNPKSVTPHLKICSLHFKRDDYILPDFPSKRRALKKNAVPSMNLPVSSIPSKIKFTRKKRRNLETRVEIIPAISIKMDPEKFRLPPKFWPCEENVWMEYADMARKYKPLNLGQGAPDFTAPKILSDALEEVTKCTDPIIHQYTRGFGHPRLVNALSQIYSPLLQTEIHPLDEIMIANGATEALYCAIIGFINKGDEVILMEPYFDCYHYLIQMAEGTARYIPLRPKTNASSSSHWIFELAELESLFNSKTKMIILNTPHNPTGKVFTAKELQQIADLCIKWDVLCISDEVYEWMIYNSSQHLRIGALAGMWCRTITIGSAGKSFSATGWKIGWAFGPSNLLHNLRVIHQNCVYTCCSPLQEALARVFEREKELLFTKESYFTNLMDSLEKKRDFVARMLLEVGMRPMVPDGGYFMLAEWTNLASKADLDSETDKYKDYRFTKWMSKNLGLQVIPLSAFYSEPNKHLGESFVRFCFIKEDINLQKAAQILRTWKRIE